MTSGPETSVFWDQIKRSRFHNVVESSDLFVLEADVFHNRFMSVSGHSDSVEVRERALYLSWHMMITFSHRYLATT